MKIKIVTIAALTFFLSACNSEDTKTVEFYKQNEMERTAKIKECTNNPGKFSGTANCKNAKEAVLKLSSGNLNTWSLPSKE